MAHAILSTHAMSFMVRVDTSRGFIGTSVMTQALMKEGPPEKVVGKSDPVIILRTRRIPILRKVSFGKT